MDEQVHPDTEEDNTVAEDESGTVHPSAMRGVFNSVADFVAGRVFGGVVIHESSVRKIRDLAKRGTGAFVPNGRAAGWGRGGSSGVAASIKKKIDRVL
ncbi:MAG: hypothetical protein H8E45_09270, partial [Proteobacteria bacterium]|nr:hypothetical protein [Pseudomonadota bacterium]